MQTYRSQKAADNLRAGVALTANTLRDGKWIEIQRNNLVPGDMIRLTAGDMVPADAHLVQATDLQVQQAALTGESQPVEKNADELDVPTENLAEVHNKVFLGTSVASGTATALVIAVGLTPEGLPMITTMTLSVGAQRMAKQKVIVKYLESIQNFGSIDTFCSDKTGTLTSGETQLEKHLDLSNQASDRVLLFGYLNSSYETGIKSPLDQAILQSGSVDTGGYSKVGEIPFDFERRRLSVIVQHQDELLLITKGAPESVLPFCSTYEINNMSKPLDDAARAPFVKMYQDLNTQGYRVLAVA